MITVWRIALDATRPPPPDDLAILPAAERARAARFLREADRHRWLQARAAMRRILGEALHVAPGAIEFGAGAAGKPHIASPAGTSLEFNFSDSGDLALLAISAVGPVGVDVESGRPLTDMAAIAESHFAEEERAALFALPEPERAGGFYRLWTRKEAYIKAIGTGLAHPLGRFAVTIGHEDARFLHIDGDVREARQWTLTPIEVPARYVGALVYRGRDAPLVVRDAP